MKVNRDFWYQKTKRKFCNLTEHVPNSQNGCVSILITHWCAKHWTLIHFDWRWQHAIIEILCKWFRNPSFSHKLDDLVSFRQKKPKKLLFNLFISSIGNYWLHIEVEKKTDFRTTKNIPQLISVWHIVCRMENYFVW